MIYPANLASICAIVIVKSVMMLARDLGYSWEENYRELQDLNINKYISANNIDVDTKAPLLR